MQVRPHHGSGSGGVAHLRAHLDHPRLVKGRDRVRGRVRGGIRGTVRGGVRGRVRGGVRGGVMDGVRGGFMGGVGLRVWLEKLGKIFQEKPNWRGEGPLITRR